MNTRIIQTGLLVIAVIILFFIIMKGKGATPAVVEKPSTTVAFSCDNSKGIIAAFYNGSSTPATVAGGPPTPGGKVSLSFSDGRAALTLAQTISADGARYANADESFVFWGKGNGAMVLEGGKEQSYVGCIVVAPDPTNGSLPLVFSNGAAGFSLRLPQGFTVTQGYHYQDLGPGKDIAGIKFTIATSLATGTNLGADSYVSVEGIPLKNATTTSCTAGLFLDKSAKPQMVTEGTATYSVGATQGAGAGNRYDQVVYAIPGTNPCIGFRYYIHYGVIENYPKGTVEQFDEKKLLADFDLIRHTLVLNQVAQ